MVEDLTKLFVFPHVNVISRTSWEIPLKFGSNVHSDSQMNQLDLDGQMSRSRRPHNTLWNMISQERLTGMSPHLDLLSLGLKEKLWFLLQVSQHHWAVLQEGWRGPGHVRRNPLPLLHSGERMDGLCEGEQAEASRRVGCKNTKDLKKLFPP